MNGLWDCKRLFHSSGERIVFSFSLGFKSLPIYIGHHNIYIPMKGMGLHSTRDRKGHSLDFYDQYNNVTNSTGPSLDPCSWWPSIMHNAFTVLIL